MDILIKETSEAAILTLIDPKTNLCFIGDFIGNTNAFNEGQFEWDEEKDVYHVSQDDFDWWNKVINDNQALLTRINDLVIEHDYDAVYGAIGDSGNCDLEDYAAIVNQAIDAVFGEVE